MLVAIGVVVRIGVAVAWDVAVRVAVRTGAGVGVGSGLVATGAIDVQGERAVLAADRSRRRR